MSNVSDSEFEQRRAAETQLARSTNADGAATSPFEALNAMTRDGYHGPNMLHTIPPDDPNLLAYLLAAQNPQETNIDEVEGKEFPLRCWVAESVLMEDDQDKSDKQSARIALFSPNNEMMRFVSGGIARSLAKIVQFTGLKTYDPPLTIIPRRYKTQQGRTSYYLEIPFRKPGETVADTH